MISVTHVVMFFSRNFLFVFYDLRMCMKEEESLGSNYFKGDNSECWSDLTLVLLVLIFIHPRVIVTYCSSTLVYTHKVIQFFKAVQIIHVNHPYPSFTLCVYSSAFFYTSLERWKESSNRHVIYVVIISHKHFNTGLRFSIPPAFHISLLDNTAHFRILWPLILTCLWPWPPNDLAIFFSFDISRSEAIGFNVILNKDAEGTILHSPLSTFFLFTHQSDKFTSYHDLELPMTLVFDNLA